MTFDDVPQLVRANRSQQLAPIADIRKPQRVTQQHLSLEEWKSAALDEFVPERVSGIDGEVSDIM
jgi:hypothetical protein